MSSMKAMAQQLINELDELLQFITRYEESDRYIPFDYRHMHPLKLTYEVLKLVSRNLKVRQNCPYYLNPVDNKIQEDEVEEANQLLWDKLNRCYGLANSIRLQILFMPYDEGEKPVKFNLNIGNPYCKKSKSMLAKVYQLLEVCSAQVARTEPICLQLKKIKKAEQFMPVMRRLIQDPITKQLLIECLTEIRSIDLARYQKWFDLLDKLESGFVSESDYQEFKQFKILEVERLRLHEKVPEWIYIALKKAEDQQQFVPIISNLLHDPQAKPLFLEFLRENYSLLDEELFKFINKIKAETLSEQDVEVFWKFGAYRSTHHECFNRLKEKIYSFLTNDMPWNITGIEDLLGIINRDRLGHFSSCFEIAIDGLSVQKSEFWEYMSPAKEDLEEQYKIYQQLHPLTQDLAALNKISQTVSLPLKWDVMLTTTVEQIVNEHDLKAISRLYLASIGEPNLLTLLSPPKYRDILAQIIERFKTNTILQEGNGYAKY